MSLLFSFKVFDPVGFVDTRVEGRRIGAPIFSYVLSYKRSRNSGPFGRKQTHALSKIFRKTKLELSENALIKNLNVMGCICEGCTYQGD